jgi:NAD(P)-dependent dehydrogenase (short-subunit alcohol dehydrogenase family)
MSDRGVAVVSGAATGIGAAVAGALGQDFDVVGLDLRPGEGDWPMFGVDVTDRQAVEDVAREIEDRHGAVTAVVNNAGVLTMNRFVHLTDQDWRRVFDVNVYGVFLLGQVFGRRMAERGRGRIVNMASVAGKIPLPDQAHYCASKAAVIMLTRCMALELAPAGVWAFAVCPGAVDTELFRSCLAWTAARDGRDPEDTLAQWVASSAVGRLIEPAEVAALVRFLLIGPTEAMAGDAVSIDGGRAQW